MRTTLLTLILACAPAAAQDFHNMINFDKLAEKSIEQVNVTLDGDMLKLAGAFLSGNKPDEAEVKALIGGIKGIYVRSLQFSKEGEYSMADVDAIRSKLTGWAKIVDVRSSKGGDNAGVYMKTDGNSVQGIVVIAAEPKELTVVNIVGNIDPAKLRNLSGKFGIPNMDFGSKPTPKPAAAPKKDDE